MGAGDTRKDAQPTGKWVDINGRLTRQQRSESSAGVQGPSSASAAPTPSTSSAPPGLGGNDGNQQQPRQHDKTPTVGDVHDAVNALHHARADMQMGIDEIIIDVKCMMPIVESAWHAKIPQLRSLVMQAIKDIEEIHAKNNDAENKSFDIGTPERGEASHGSGAEDAVKTDKDQTAGPSTTTPSPIFAKHLGFLETKNQNRFADLDRRMDVLVDNFAALEASIKLDFARLTILANDSANKIKHMVYAEDAQKQTKQITQLQKAMDDLQTDQHEACKGLNAMARGIADIKRMHETHVL